MNYSNAFIILNLWVYDPCVLSILVVYYIISSIFFGIPILYLIDSFLCINNTGLLIRI